MKHIKLFEAKTQPVKIGMVIKGGLSLSFAEGVLKQVWAESTNSVNSKNKPLKIFNYLIRITKNHGFSKQKAAETVIKVFAVTRKEADENFLKRVNF